MENGKDKIVAFILGMALMGGIVYFYGSGGDRVTVKHLPSYSFSDIPGLVGGFGTWTAKGEELANKFNAAQINCFNTYGDVSFEDIRGFGVDPTQAEMYCYIAQADIIDGFLNVDLQIMPITDWNMNTVTAESTGLCRRVVMTLDRASQTITQTGTLIDSEGICEGLSEEPIQSYLTDGLKVLEE